MSQTITPSEAHEILSFVCKSNLQTGNHISVSLLGDAGIGKTSVAKQVANALGIPFKFISLANYEPGDLMGLQYQAVKVTDGKESLTVDLKSLSTYLDRGFKQIGGVISKFTEPEWLTDKPMILLLDDYTRAKADMLSAVMELIVAGRIGEWKLPKGSTVMLTENPDNGEFMVNSVDAATLSRYLQYTLVFNHTDWLKYAESIQLPSECISFIYKYPEVVKGSSLTTKSKDSSKGDEPNIRTWTMFFKLIANMGNYRSTANINMISMLAGNSIPQAYVMMFIKHLQTKLSEIASPLEILSNEHTADTLGKYLNSLGNKDEKESIRTLLNMRFANFITLNPDMILGTPVLSKNVQLLLEADYLSPDVKTGIALRISASPLKVLIENNVKLALLIANINN